MFITCLLFAYKGEAYLDGVSDTKLTFKSLPEKKQSSLLCNCKHAQNYYSRANDLRQDNTERDDDQD